MLSVTLSQYKKDYLSRLEFYMSDYEDNVKNDFLRKELNDYSLCQSALIKISRAKVNYKNETIIKVREIDVLLLKRINPLAYNDIIIDLETEEELKQQSLKFVGIDSVKFENYSKSLQRILDFIHEEFSVQYTALRMVSNDSTSDITENASVINDLQTVSLPAHIFINDDAFNLFKLLHGHYKDSKNKLADFSFIYRIMIKEKLIISTVKSQTFIEWMSKEYDISLYKFKTLDKCLTDSKMNIYKMTKEKLAMN